MTKLLVVDDHPLFRAGFAHMVQALRPEWILRFADSAPAALVLLESFDPDLAIIDVSLPGDDGFSLLEAIARRAPQLRQVLISGRNDAAVRARALACGARGFITKAMDPQALAATLDSLLRGDTAFEVADRAGGVPMLTARQAEILDLLAQGHGNKEIRHRLGIAERTVRAHLTDLFHLLGVQSRTQALIRARDLGLAP